MDILSIFYYLFSFNLFFENKLQKSQLLGKDMKISSAINKLRLEKMAEMLGVSGLKLMELINSTFNMILPCLQSPDKTRFKAEVSTAQYSLNTEKIVNTTSASTKLVSGTLQARLLLCNFQIVQIFASTFLNSIVQQIV